jgi:hypothetical protein
MAAAKTDDGRRSSARRRRKKGEEKKEVSSFGTFIVPIIWSALARRQPEEDAKRRTQSTPRGATVKDNKKK